MEKLKFYTYNQEDEKATGNGDNYRPEAEPFHATKGGR